jgi:hypothetical protein
MSILTRARQIESKLARTIDRAAQRWSQSGPRGPLEIRHAVLEAVEDRIEPAGRGTHVFPFNRIKVSVVAPSREARLRWAAVLDEAPSLQDRIATRLQERGCEAGSLQVRVVYAAQPEPEWMTPEMHVEFARVSTSEAAPASVVATRDIRLTVVSGSAEKPVYVLTLGRINLGRNREVRDRGHRLVRTNHVAFTDGGGPVNETVSRCHGHIDYLDSAGEYRITDDGSAHGTTIVRGGRTVPVPAGSRGVRLQAGDEVVLGEARLRIGLGVRS